MYPTLRMPAEWEPHAATWIAWPHRTSDWPGRFAAIRWVYAEIVRHLHQSELVCIEVQDAAHRDEAKRLLRRYGVDLARVQFLPIPTNRSWTRDHGPTFVRDPERQLHIIDWHFNGWAKYPDWELDDAVPARIAQRLGYPHHRPSVRGRRVVLEGGSIDVNGAGLLLTTEECLLSDVQARNPDLSRDELQEVLRQYLGAEKVLWLGRGIAGDDTHGHIDDLARFVGPRTVVLAVEHNPHDENYQPTQENRERLQGMTDQAGQRLEVIELPMPQPVVYAKQRLPASYANFYIANDRVLVPTFNDPADRVALGILADLFPDRLVVGINCTDLVWGLGTLHCMTQQQPIQQTPPAHTVDHTSTE